MGTPHNLFGRRVIYTDEDAVTENNIISVIQKAYVTHQENKREIQLLDDYNRGRQAILGKVKEVRENINHKVCMNWANRIVKFNLGYTFGEPIQYIYSGSSEEKKKEIELLNEYMKAEEKSTLDTELAEWMYICGVGYRAIIPSTDDNAFKIYTLDPRNTFIVRYSRLGKPVALAVTYIVKEDKSVTFSAYTDTAMFEISNDVSGEVKIIKIESFFPTGCPIVEYPIDSMRQGAFEIVISIIDAINEIESNRIDDIVQFVNSFLAIMGGQLDTETYQRFQKDKMLFLPDGTDAKYLSVPMSQSDIQTLVDNLKKDLLEICGMPNRNGGSSTSDTGAAVIMRDGWEDTEANAKTVEKMFKRSEKILLNQALKIMRAKNNTIIEPKDIEIRFTRRNYEAIATKSSVLTQLLNNEFVDPETAYTYSGMFVDPHNEYKKGMAWRATLKAEEGTEYEKIINQTLNSETNGNEE